MSVVRVGESFGPSFCDSPTSRVDIPLPSVRRRRREWLSQCLQSSPTPAVFHAPAPVVEYISPAPPATHAPAPVLEYISPTLAAFRAPAPDLDFFSPAPAVFQALSPIVEYISPTPAVVHAPVKWRSLFCQCRTTSASFVCF